MKLWITEYELANSSPEYVFVELHPKLTHFTP